LQRGWEAELSRGQAKWEVGGCRGGGSRGQKNRRLERGGRLQRGGRPGARVEARKKRRPERGGRLQRGGRPGTRVEARKKKEAGKGREAVEGGEAEGESRGQEKKKEARKGWETRGESSGQKNRRLERDGRLGGVNRGQKGPLLLASSLSLSLFPALFIPLIPVLSRSVCSASHSSYCLIFSVLFLHIVCSEASCLGSRVSYEL